MFREVEEAIKKNTRMFLRPSTPGEHLLSFGVAGNLVAIALLIARQTPKEVFLGLHITFDAIQFIGTVIKFWELRQEKYS